MPVPTSASEALIYEAIRTPRGRGKASGSLHTIKRVLRSVADANVGSILGIGFPVWTGGVLQYVNQYAGGPAGFAARARELASRYGERFTPPASLAAKAQNGEVYR